MDAPYLKNIDLPLEAIRAFCERNHVRRLALFGSVLRDDFRPDGDDPSDIDVLIEFEPGHTPGLQFVDMIDELAELFGRKVDLIIFDSLRGRMRDALLNHQVIYVKP